MDCPLIITLMLAFLIVVFALGYSVFQRFAVAQTFVGPTGPPGPNVTSTPIANFNFDLGNFGLADTDINIQTTTNQHLYLQDVRRSLQITLQDAQPGNLIYINNSGSLPARICTICADGSTNCATGACPNPDLNTWTFLDGNSDAFSYTLPANEKIGIYILPGQNVILDSDFP